VNCPKCELPIGSCRCYAPHRSERRRVRRRRTHRSSLLPSQPRSEASRRASSTRKAGRVSRKKTHVDGERRALLASIAQTIQDYREGCLLRPISQHVERWVQQFDPDVQVPILKEVNYVLKKTYFSKERVMDFLRRLIDNEKLTGHDPQRFWRSVQFLDIQARGNSQKDMLALFSEALRDKFGFGIEACSRRNEDFIYLDDGIFTGKHLRVDLKSWIHNKAPKQAQVHVVCIALHRYGQYYAKTRLQEAIQEAQKDIEIRWWWKIELEDRKAYSHCADVLRPTHIPNDPAVEEYVASLRYKPTLRPPGHPGAAGLFSSDEAKILLEQEFLQAGVRIRRMCPNTNSCHRPLGYMELETLGFGSPIVTYRNCPNTAPLAFWFGSPWYPLFPRITNRQTDVESEDFEVPF